MEARLTYLEIFQKFSNYSNTWAQTWPKTGIDKFWEVFRILFCHNQQVGYLLIRLCQRSAHVSRSHLERWKLEILETQMSPSPLTWTGEIVWWGPSQCTFWFENEFKMNYTCVSSLQLWVVSVTTFLSERDMKYYTNKVEKPVFQNLFCSGND